MHADTQERTQVCGAPLLFTHNKNVQFIVTTQRQRSFAPTTYKSAVKIKRAEYRNCWSYRHAHILMQSSTGLLFCHKGEQMQNAPHYPCPAELFQLYFSSFEAGISNAISSSKWRTIFIFFVNIHPLNWVIRQTEHIYHKLYYPFQWHIIWYLFEAVYIRA